MLLQSKGKNLGTTNYRSCTQGVLNEPLFLTGILWRKKHANVAPTDLPEPQCCRADLGWQVEAEGPTLWKVTYRRAQTSKWEEPRLDFWIKEQRERENSRCEHSGTAVGRPIR